MVLIIRRYRTHLNCIQTIARSCKMQLNEYAPSPCAHFVRNKETKKSFFLFMVQVVFCYVLCVFQGHTTTFLPLLVEIQYAHKQKSAIAYFTSDVCNQIHETLQLLYNAHAFCTCISRNTALIQDSRVIHYQLCSKSCEGILQRQHHLSI